MKYSTREEIVNALVVAAELEHGLMVQYLYAEMTLKDQNDGLPADHWAKVKNWAPVIGLIARQEMGHLATVLNLLEAVGGGSYLNRLRLPSASGLYTPPVSFSLEPLTSDTIQRFIQFEMPVHPVAALAGLAPVQIVVEHVGQLYTDIWAAIDNFTEAGLFIGQAASQDQAPWSFGITVTPVTNKASAKAAIDSIILEGEGNSTGHDQSHFGRFRKMQDEYQQLANADPAFQPHRNVLSNPATLDPSVAPGTNAITNPDTKDVAELFSACYTTLLLMLVKYYRFDESADNQDALQGAAKTMMMRVIATTGRLLSTLPATAEKNAGPPFEIYTLPSLPYARAASLRIISERLGIEQAFAVTLAAKNPAIADVAASLGDIAAAIPD